MKLPSPIDVVSAARTMANVSNDSLLARYLAVRARTEALASPLSPEDQMLQSMPDCSPTRWHRAHTTWFFETFLLAPRGVPAHRPDWAILFNSYYEAVGPRHPRARRGIVSRPSVAEIGEYRAIVDARMHALIDAADAPTLAAMTPLLELGLAHEEQHQELLLTDILSAFADNPLGPIYRAARSQTPVAAPSPIAFRSYQGGLVEIGVDAHAAAFAFDNEAPRHRVWLPPFAIADRLVTVGEVKAFLLAGGYRTPSLWLSEGLEWVRTHAIEAPEYARLDGGEYVAFGLEGERVCSDAEPAVHLSFYEADAIAHFLGGRLPTEAEWEHAASDAPVVGHFLDDDLRPLPAIEPERGRLFGDAWTWTRSSYEPYPGYAAGAGAIGEYNGKFMVGQRVLRGGSFLTPAGHLRATYRNFWPPATRFQATGLRLAKDV
jgi:ergothioneine biosynthesis protein EgtB